MCYVMLTENKRGIVFVFKAKKKKEREKKFKQTVAVVRGVIMMCAFLHSKERVSLKCHFLCVTDTDICAGGRL